MKVAQLTLIGGAAAAVGAAAAGAYRATHPAGAQRVAPSSGSRRRLPDALFDMPDGLAHHELPTRDAGVVHVVEKGEGRPLVLLHGITLRADVWAPQFHHLAGRYRLVAPDLRGHGRSVAGSDGYGIARLAADLATVLEDLDLHDAIVVGHSMGGMTAMQFCADFVDVLAERVGGLVFLATRAHRVVPPYSDRAARALLATGQARLERGLDLRLAQAVNLRLARFAFGDRPSPKAMRILAEMGQSMEPEALLPSVAGLMEHDARSALRATHTPSLVVVGTRDVLTPVPAASHLAHLLPASELAVLPGAGHQLMQERPDELAELIDAFCVRLDGRAATVEEAVATSPGVVQPGQVHDPGDPVDPADDAAGDAAPRVAAPAGGPDTGR